MEEVKEINIKNRTYYFYKDMINLKHDLSQSFIKIDKKHYKEISIYYIGYITIRKIHDYKSIYSVNLLYLKVNHASRYIEKKNGNKYLIFNSTDENKEIFKNVRMFGVKLKTKSKQ